MSALFQQAGPSSDRTVGPLGEGERKAVHLPWGQALCRAWRWTPGSGPEALVWSLSCEIMECPHKQQEQPMLRSSWGKQQEGTSVRRKWGLGNKSNARPPFPRSSCIGNLLREVAVHENRSEVCPST